MSDNTLALSDEEFAKLNFDDFTSEAETTDTEVEVEVEEEEVLEESSEEEVEEASSEAVADDSEDSDEEVEEEVEEPQEEESTDTEGTEEEVQEPSEEVKPTTDNQESIDYGEVGKKLFEPFKANGKEIQITKVEDAISLMQMGANYNKKMAGLKPNLKLLKMLENHNLLSEDKLTYLIDLDKKNPEAIKKLVKEGGLDPLEMDLEAPSAYTPNTYTVDDQSIEIDSILADIKDTESFDTTLDIIGNKWDIASRNIIANQPELIKIINNHVESGVYQQIKQVIDSERMFGRLAGLSDLEAYKQVGESLNSDGRFNSNPTQPNQTPATNVKAKTKTVDKKLKSRKKAASSTKHAASAPKEDFNPLALSDEEFEKMAASKFI